MKKRFWPVFSRILECDKPEGRIYEYPQSFLTITFEVKGLILLHLGSCWIHKFSKIKGNLSSEEMILANFLAHSRVSQTSVNTLYGSTKYFDNYSGSYRINSVTPKKLLKTQIFEKKGKLSSEEKILANFLAHSRVGQTSVNTLYGSTKYFDNYSGSYRVNSVTPNKLLKTQLFEKSNFPVRKSFWPVFSLILECDKPKGRK